MEGNRVLKKTSSSKGLKSAGLLAVGLAYDLSKLYFGHFTQYKRLSFVRAACLNFSNFRYLFPWEYDMSSTVWFVELMFLKGVRKK